MKEAANNKYLGVLLAPTVCQSVTDTVNSRVGVARKAVYEIRTIIEDSRADSVGAFQVGLNLWEMSVIPMLLFASEVFSEMPKKTMKKLEEVNSLFLANLLGVSKRGCPEVSLYLKTGSLNMTNRVLLQKLLSFHHIATLPVDSLARECYEEQKNMSNVEGIVNQCMEQLNQWGITNVQQYSKYSWRKQMKQKVKKKNFEDLLEWSKSYKKIDTNKYLNRTYEMSPYLKNLSLHDSRVLFRKNAYMLKTVRLNFKSDKRYKAEGYLCPDCIPLK